MVIFQCNLIIFLKTTCDVSIFNALGATKLFPMDCLFISFDHFPIVSVFFSLMTCRNFVYWEN